MKEPGLKVVKDLIHMCCGGRRFPKARFDTADFQTNSSIKTNLSHTWFTPVLFSIEYFLHEEKLIKEFFLRYGRDEKE